MSRRSAKKCKGKVQHETKQDAENALYAMVKKNGTFRGWLRAYKCEYCGSWHTGHVTGSGTRR